MHLHRLNNAIHRDLGYFLAGTTVLYAVSGLALNHANQWNPNFAISRQDVHTQIPEDVAAVTKQWAIGILEPLGKRDHYQSHDFPTPSKVKIYLDDGSVLVDLKTGKGVLESVTKRSFLYQINCLHVSPKQAWLLFSDFLAAGLVVVSVTGLFMLKGRNGIAGRGAVLAAAGILIPLAFVLSIR